MKAATARATISTFSCDIAYSDSPAASRASASAPVEAEHRDSMPFAHRGALRIQRAPISIRCRSPCRASDATRSQAMDSSAIEVSQRSSISADRAELPLRSDRLQSRAPVHGLVARLDLPSTASTNSTSGSRVASSASRSPRLQASKPRRTISTFSCDIAYSDSPAASRASARGRVLRDIRTILPVPERRQQATCRLIDADSAAPCPRRWCAEHQDLVAQRRRTPRARSEYSPKHARSSSARSCLHAVGPTKPSQPPAIRASIELDVRDRRVRRALRDPPVASARSRAARSPRSPATSPTPTARRLRGLRWWSRSLWQPAISPPWKSRGPQLESDFEAGVSLSLGPRAGHPGKIPHHRLRRISGPPRLEDRRTPGSARSANSVAP